MQAALEQLKTEDPDEYQRVMRQMQQSQNQPASPEAELRAILSELNKPPCDRRDMPRRVELCRRALHLLPRAGNEMLWAALQVELGNALAQNPTGEWADNVEQAIAAYQQALTVRTPQALPLEWAGTMNNLANAYRERIRGQAHAAACPSLPDNRLFKPPHYSNIRKASANLTRNVFLSYALEGVAVRAD